MFLGMISLQEGFLGWPRAPTVGRANREQNDMPPLCPTLFRVMVAAHASSRHALLLFDPPEIRTKCSIPSEATDLRQYSDAAYEAAGTTAGSTSGFVGQASGARLVAGVVPFITIDFSPGGHRHAVGLQTTRRAGRIFGAADFEEALPRTTS